jgi:hypothetical protein
VKEIGWCYYVKSDFNLAMQQYELALKVLPENVDEKDKIRKQKVYAAIFGNIGIVYKEPKVIMSRHWTIISRH